MEKINLIKEDNKSGQGFPSFLTFTLYIIILVSGILLMPVLGLLSLWQRLTTSKQDRLKEKQEIAEQERLKKHWGIFASSNNFIIERQLAGSLPWDGGDYLYLKSKPTIPFLEEKIFGEWRLFDFGGIFLQKWNDTRNITCDLLFIDFTTLEIIVLQKNIPTKYWTTEKINQNEIKFTFLAADHELIYVVKRNELNN